MVSAQEDQAGTARRTLVRSARAIEPQSLRLVPWLAKKKKENKTSARQTKASDARLEDFMDWMGIIANELAKEEEMSSLVISTQKVLF